jgi:hypothetical protein
MASTQTYEFNVLDQAKVSELYNQLYFKHMNFFTKIKCDAIKQINPKFPAELYLFQNDPYTPGMLSDDQFLKQFINDQYLMTVEGYSEEAAQQKATEIERKLVHELNAKLKTTLDRAFTQGVLVKDCSDDGGSNTLLGNTKKPCCSHICEKINNLVRELEEILTQHSIEMGSKTIAEVASSLGGLYTVGYKKSNIFNYFKKCKENDNIDDKTYQTTRSNIEKLSFFLGIPSQQEQTAGYSKNKYRHTSKKSRKSRGRGRRHRRSSYNKKHHVKRHTKRYRKRK